MLPELRRTPVAEPALDERVQLGDDVMSARGVAELLRAHRLMLDDVEPR